MSAVLNEQYQAGFEKALRDARSSGGNTGINALDGLNSIKAELESAGMLSPTVFYNLGYATGAIRMAYA